MFTTICLWFVSSALADTNCDVACEGGSACDIVCGAGTNATCTCVDQSPDDWTSDDLSATCVCGPIPQVPDVRIQPTNGILCKPSGVASKVMLNAPEQCKATEETMTAYAIFLSQPTTCEEIVNGHVIKTFAGQPELTFQMCHNP